MDKQVTKTINPEMLTSFSKEIRDLNRHQIRNNIEILRVHTLQKRKYLCNIWLMNQQQLCQFFQNFQLFPQENLSLQQLLDSNRLKLIKGGGKLYFGEINQKKRQGKGIYISNERKVYEGGFYNNQKNGPGIQLYPNNNLYIGEFMNNKKHGQGKFYWFNLSSKNPKSDDFVQYYEGQWWGGLPDGFGVHQKLNGDLYTGILKNGLKHGQGTEIYGNGDFYKGEFVNGMPQGYGQYVWEDGSMYKGDFKQGLRNGYGVWQANKSRIQSYKGHYAMDKKCGYGVYTWDNGWCFKGNFQNDEKNGYGELYESDNNLHYKGFWQNGQKTQKQLKTTNKQKETNFRSIQHPKQNQNKKEKIEIFGQNEIKSRGSSVKANFMSEMKGIHTFQPHRFAQRPKSNTNVKKVKRPCTGLNKSTKYSQNSKTISNTTNRLFVGTIKSNLFVPYNYSS